MTTIEHTAASLREALDTNNSTLFAETLNAFLDDFDKERYGKTNRLWELHVGCEETFCPSIERTEYEQIYRYNLNGTFSYQNKKRVLNDGEDILAAIDRASSWTEGYSRWMSHTCRSEVKLSIYTMQRDDDELTVRINIPAGPQCRKEFLEAIVNHLTKALDRLSDIRKAREAFDGSRYGFSEGITDYSGWVAQYLPAILAANGIDGKRSWYDGISIRDAGCDFWNGSLQSCTPDGIILWVGGDSTDDEKKVPYSQWSSAGTFRWRSDHAGVTAVIDSEKRQTLSKKIYVHMQSLCRNGKLK